MVWHANEKESAQFQLPISIRSFKSLKLNHNSFHFTFLSIYSSACKTCALGFILKILKCCKYIFYLFWLSQWGVGKKQKIEKKWYVPFHPLCTVLETKKNITFRSENRDFAEFCCTCAYCSSRRPCDWPFCTTTQIGKLGRRLSNHNVFKNKRLSSCFANGPIKLKIQICNRWKL